MNHRRLFSALSAGVITAAAATSSFAQAAPQPPAAAQQAPVAPAAIPAKIALVAFEQAVFATNEGQRAVLDVQKKFEPTKAKIDAQSAEVDNLKKQLQAATTLSEADRAARVRTIDTKEKALTRDGEDASQSYQQEIQEAYGRVATKVADVMRKYVSDNGYTILLDVSGQQSPVMWAQPQTDVTRAVIDAYNTSSGVAAPPAGAGAARPSSPTPNRPAGPRPAAR